MPRPVKYDCDICGKAHPRCWGHRTGIKPKVPCMRHPAKGGDFCLRHGANLPGVKEKAAKNYALQLSQKHYKTFGEPIPHNLAEGILEEISWAKGHLVYLRERIRELAGDDVVWGLSEYSDKTGGEDWGVKSTEKAGVNTWVKLYYEQQKIYLDLVKSAHSMGIEERRIKLAETYGSSLLRFADIFATALLEGLGREGWVLEELEEVWPALLQATIPQALTAMKESVE